jgi:hypothetical protein
MQPALDDTTLDHLISLGRQRGHLTTADLHASLPIVSMRTEEIAHVIVQLEESGINVELEDRLIPEGGALIIPFPQRAANIRKTKPPFAGGINVSPARRPQKLGAYVPVTLQTQHALPDSVSPEPKISVAAQWMTAGAGLLSLGIFGLIILTVS